MSDDPNQLLEPETTAPEESVDSKSMLDKIKARRDAREDILTIDIPSWDGELRAKYKVVERREIDKMIRRARIRAAEKDASGAATEADADFLIKACVGVIGYDSETDNEFDVGTGYNMALAERLDPRYPDGHPQAGEPVPINNPRELVVYLVRWNSIALAAHGQRVARWMQDTSKPVEDPT